MDDFDIEEVGNKQNTEPDDKIVVRRSDDQYINDKIQMSNLNLSLDLLEDFIETDENKIINPLEFEPTSTSDYRLYMKTIIQIFNQINPQDHVECIKILIDYLADRFCSRQLQELSENIVA